MDSAESENLKSEEKAQSVFSTRSGIKDLLVRPEPVPAEEQPAEAEEAKGEEDSQSDSEAVKPKDKKKNASKSRRQIDRVKRRQQNYLQERRAQKRRQVMFSRMRLLFKLCFVLLFSVLLWQIAQSPLWLFQKPQFVLRQNHLLQPSQLEPLISEWVGKPIYVLHTGKLAQDIKERFTILDNVIIRRHVFPNRLEVMVTEKQPWAEIYASETKALPYALLMPNGVISPKDYKYHRGLYKNPALEKLIIPPRTLLTPEFLTRLQEVAWQARHVRGLHFESIDARNQKLIVLRFKEIPVILGVMNASASKRLSRLPALVPKVMELRDALESVDLRWEEQVTFHKKPNAQIVFAEEESDEGH